MKRLTVVSYLLVGCASTELTFPSDHPANPKAPVQPVATSNVLGSDFDPFVESEPAPAQQHSPSKPHQHPPSKAHQP